jgi:DNA (cytosine-5)-methyltransferase 1
MGKPTVISLYSGAGGLDYGFESAGFRTAVALEVNHDSCETLRRNRRWPVVERSIFDVPSDELLEVSGLDKGEADVLIAGPPCQPFSKSGYWANGDAGRLDDTRSNTLGAFMRVLEDALPKAFVLENVEGLAYSKKSEGLQLLLDWVQEINRRTKSNYQPTFRVLKAADYGVPQMRERFFMVASRAGEVFQFPSPTHTANLARGDQLTLDSLEPYRTAWDALADVAPDADEDLSVRGKWADLLPSVPEGENYLWHTERGGGQPLFGWRRRYWSFLLKLAKNRPSWTLQAQPGPATGPFHWDNRRLSMRELCRLQTFPDDVVIYGGRTSVQKQVGNAVPSLLAEVLGRSIRRQLLGHRIQNRRLKLLPIDRSPTPPPTPPESVAPKFLALVGEHSPHPGTGQGYRASDRPKQAPTNP